MKKSVGVNLIFQLTYQVIILVIPLLLSPYLSRVVGAQELGKYTFVDSVAFYFILLANLGISKYGQRVISKCFNDIFISFVIDIL